MVRYVGGYIPRLHGVRRERNSGTEKAFGKKKKETNCLTGAVVFSSGIQLTHAV